LPLDPKTVQHFISICAPLEYFDRDSLFKLSIGAFGQINSSHTATPEFSDNHVRADSFSDSMGFVAPQTLRCKLGKVLEVCRIVCE
jgi:hypothetical protein